MASNITDRPGGTGIIKKIHTVSRLIGLVGTAMVVPIMLLTVLDVFLRYVFSSPIAGTAEITAKMMDIIFLAAAWCAVQGSHIKVDVVMDRFSPRTKAITDIIAFVLSLVIIAIIVWRAVPASLTALINRSVENQLVPIPEFPFYWIVAFSFALLFIVIVTLIIQKVREASKP